VFANKNLYTANLGSAKAQFDLKDISRTTQDGSTISSIVARQVDYDGNSSETITLGLFEQNGVIIGGMFVKTSFKSAGVKILSYYSLERVLLSEVELDLNKNISKIQFLKSIENSNMRTACGQATMDCFSDMYTNRGWGSVFMTLSSIIVPEIAVAVMAGCAAGSC